MKIIFPLAGKSSLMLLLASLFLCSCASMSGFRSDVAASRDRDRKNFVETFDGQVIEVEDVVFRHPLFGKSTVELGDGTRLDTRELKAYQSSRGYYRRINGQFAPRIRRGLINLYMISETYQEYHAAAGPAGRGGMRTRTRQVYYLQKGDAAEPEQFSPELLKAYVKDYPPALEFVAEYEREMKKVRTWSWINTTALIGGAALAIAGGTDENNELTAAGYAGLGLFVGGFVSGIVNKFRRIRPYRNLELALEEYNRQRPLRRK